jgi:mono/diheme cytochrome c family protein
MKNMFVRPLTALALFAAAGAASADVERGARLHAENCVTCHRSLVGGDGSKLYTREDRRVTSLAGLEAQVRRCENNLGLTWFDDQVADVVEYLHANYYDFQEPAGESTDEQPQE